MRTEQHDIVRAASEARVAVVPRPVVDHALLAERLRGTLIDIVGTESSENGRIRLGAQRNHTKNYLCAKPENTRKLKYLLSFSNHVVFYWLCRVSYGSLNVKIRKEIAENKGSTVLSERRVKLDNCVEQKRRE
jgi:hypothetical protein